MDRFCKRCGYEWSSRTKKPKQCPRCKNLDWNITRPKGCVNFQKIKQLDNSQSIE